MYIKAFKDYLKNPTDFFLEGNIFISDDIAKYCRLVRTPAAKGEHNVEILYGGVQFTYHPECNMGGKEFSSNSSLNSRNAIAGSVVVPDFEITLRHTSLPSQSSRSSAARTSS